MEVDARHMNLFPQQLLTNRDFVNFDQANVYGLNHPGQVGYGAPNLPTTMGDANFLPFNQPLVNCDPVQPKTSMNAESGLTCSLPNATRKRSRDLMINNNNQLNSVVLPQKITNYPNDFSSPLGDHEAFALEIQQQQLQIDHIISQHTKKIRMEVEERQKQQARLLVSAIGESVMKVIKEKDEQIQKIGKYNFALQEKLKGLYMENQLWKDLAQSHEATAMSLRCNLDQLLAHVSDQPQVPAPEEVAESCCGSNEHGYEALEVASGQRRTLAADEERCGGRGSGGGGAQGNSRRMCRKCGERESCVLLLPCRHLCLCTSCGTTLQSTCPVCNSSTTATVHVSMS